MLPDGLIKMNLDKSKQEKFEHALKELPNRLAREKRFDSLYYLLTKLTFLELKVDQDSVYNLIGDFASAIKVAPTNSPNRDLLILLEKALRRYLPFIDKHPQLLLQCLWNLCWWYDSPETNHYIIERNNIGNQSTQNSDHTLYRLMKHWMDFKRNSRMPYYWLKSLRPPFPSLNSPQIAEISGLTGVITSMDYSARMNRLAACSSQTQIHIWDVITLQQIVNLQISEYEIIDIALSKDGKFLYAASRDSLIYSFDIELKKIVKKFQGHDGVVGCVSVNPVNERFIISGGEDNKILLWDVLSSHVMKEFVGHTDPPVDIKYSPCSQYIASGGYDHSLIIWDVKTGSIKHQINAHSGPINAICWSPDSDRIATGSDDNMAKIWDSITGNNLHTIRNHHDHIECLLWQPDGKYLYTGSSDKTIKKLDGNTFEEISSYVGHTSPVVTLCYLKDYNRIVSGAGDSTIRIWDLVDSPYKETKPAHDGWINSMRISSDGESVITCSDDQTVKFWNFQGQEKLCLRQRNKGVQSFVITIKDDFILYGTIKGNIFKQNLKTNEIVYKWKAHKEAILSLALTPDNLVLASSAEDELIKLWDLIDYHEIHTLDEHNDWVRDLMFTQDKRLLLSALSDKTIRLWDVETFEEIKRFNGHEEDVLRAEFSEDEKQIISSDFDVTKIWDLDSLKCLKVYDGICDVHALGRKSSKHPYLALSRKDETYIINRETEEVVAIYPVRFQSLVSCPYMPQWVGSDHNLLHFIQLNASNEILNTSKKTLHDYEN